MICFACATKCVRWFGQRIEHVPCTPAAEMLSLPVPQSRRTSHFVPISLHFTSLCIKISLCVAMAINGNWLQIINEMCIAWALMWRSNAFMPFVFLLLLLLLFQRSAQQALAMKLNGLE